MTKKVPEKLRREEGERERTEKRTIADDMVLDAHQGHDFCTHNTRTTCNTHTHPLTYTQLTIHTQPDDY